VTHIVTDDRTRVWLDDLARLILHDKDAPAAAILAAWRGLYRGEFGELLEMAIQAQEHA
jgi:hypothetical protein